MAPNYVPASSYNYLFEKLSEDLQNNPKVYENGVKHSDYLVRLVRNAFYAEKLENPITAILSLEIVLSYLQENTIEDISDEILLTSWHIYDVGMSNSYFRYLISVTTILWLKYKL